MTWPFTHYCRTVLQKDITNNMTSHKYRTLPVITGNTGPPPQFHFGIHVSPCATYYFAPSAKISVVDPGSKSNAARMPVDITMINVCKILIKAVFGRIKTICILYIYIIYIIQSSNMYNMHIVLAV